MFSAVESPTSGHIIILSYSRTLGQRLNIDTIPSKLTYDPPRSHDPHMTHHHTCSSLKRMALNLCMTTSNMLRARHNLSLVRRSLSVEGELYMTFVFIESHMSEETHAQRFRQLLLKYNTYSRSCDRTGHGCTSYRRMLKTENHN